MVEAAAAAPVPPKAVPAADSELLDDPLNEWGSLYNMLLFGHAYPAVRKASKGTLRKADLKEVYPMGKWESAKDLSERLQAADGDSLAGKLLSTLRWPLVGSGLMVAVFAASNLALPALIGMFIRSVQAGEADGWKWALIIAVVKVAGNFADQVQQHIGWRLGQRVRATIIAAVYRAALVDAPVPVVEEGDVDEDGKAKAPAGPAKSALLNLVSNDAQKLLEVTPLAHQLWAAPLMILIASGMLISILGLAALAGIAALLVLAPLNVAVLKSFNTLRGQHLTHTDKRVSLLSEAIRSMRMIKYFAWERPLYVALQAVREAEMVFVGKELSLFAVNISLMITFPVWATTTGLSIYALNNNLTAADAFSALLYFAILRFPLQALAMVSAAAVQANVALKRLQGVMEARATELGARKTAAAALVPSGSTPLPQALQDVGAYGGGGDWAAVVTRAAGQYVRWVPGQGKEPTVDEPLVQVQGAVLSWQHGVSPTAPPQSEPAALAGPAPPLSREGSTGASGAGGDDFAVRGLTMRVCPGELLAVVGAVGAGKSTIVSGLLGECLIAPQPDAPADAPPAVQLHGAVAYVPQVAWIMNASIRDNITFGRPFKQVAYDEVLEASALGEDLAIMPAGDRTVIGELGVTLSGGQQQRCSLARAAYACLVAGTSSAEPKASVLLADDPLSALDAHTGAHVFQAMFSADGILRHTARILVTHAIQYVPRATRVLAVRHGRTVWSGPFVGMRPMVDGVLGGAPTPACSTADAQWLDEAVLQPLASEGVGEGEAAEAEEADGAGTGVDAAEVTLAAVETAAGPKASKVEEDGELMTEEEQAQGSVSLTVLMAWVNAAGGPGILALIVLILALERCAFVAVDWWLATWTSAADTADGSTLEGLPDLNQTSRREFFVPVYVLLTAGMTVLVFLRCLMWAWVGTRAARALQDGMLRRLLRAPVAFFDTTPAGRIISRCSHDVEVADFLLVRNLMASAASVGWLVSGIITMCAVTPLASVVLIPVVVVFFFLQRFSRSALRDLQRLDNITRSPIAAHLSETLAGGATIRAFGPVACRRFVTKADALTDVNTASLAALKNVNRWLGIRVDLLSSLITVAVALASWMARDTLQEGLAGLSLMWSFNVTVSLTFFIQFGVEAEAKLVSVERIQHYTDTVRPEAPMYTACPSELALPAAEAEDTMVLPPALAVALVRDVGEEPPTRPAAEVVGPPAGPVNVPVASWPTAGAVSFQGVCLRYRPGLPLALRELTFDVPAGSHVGICGRTGAGKSSISVALFRLVELAGGSITVDGIGLSTIGLSYLRGQRGGICIVPQAPTLMATTVRNNLDRFGEFTDDAVADALAAVHMLRKCARMSRSAGDAAGAAAAPGASPTGSEEEKGEEGTPMHDAQDTADALACVVAEGGGNFSVGEAQLLCLARALLRKPKVLVMDEASASVDSQTETKLVATVRSRFANTTVLTIAHRLFTLAHSDQILLLDQGQLLEYAPPGELLANPESRFSALVDAMGADSSAAFRGQVAEIQAAGGRQGGAGQVAQ